MARKKSLVPTLAAMAGFAMAYRQAGRQRTARLESLRPRLSRESRPEAERAIGTGVRPERARLAGTGGRSDLGQGASAPEEIPPAGWWAIAKRTARKFSENELLSEAASVTFFALLSLAPAITAIVSIYGLFADPSTIQSHLDDVAGFVPSGGMQILQDQVKRLTESPAGGLSVGAAVGIGAALWSANQGSKAMLSALNGVYGEKENRGFVKLTATSLAFTVGGVAALLGGLALLLVLPVVFGAIGLAGILDDILKLVRWPVILVGLVAALATLYRFGPSRHRARWRWISWGGVIGAVSWVALSYGFSWYVAHFGNYNKTYGSLGAVIGFMTWIWLSSTVLLLGAQINAEMEAQTARDTTVGSEGPPGTRRAAAADTVA